MLPSTALPVRLPVSSNQVVDEEGQQHLEVQEHAAAVQLLSRSLAVAHLRAELAKPRGHAVVVKPKEASAVAVKLEPGLQQPEPASEQKPGVWQLPQQPRQKPAAAAPEIAITVSSSLQGEPAAAEASTQQQAPVRRPRPSARRPAYKPPDPAAVSKWLHGEDMEQIEDASAVRIGYAAEKQAQPVPRITADPMLQAQQLSGWTRLGADGVAAEAAGGQAGEQEAAVGMEGVGGPGAAGEPQEDEDDFMEEEEWI